MGRHGFVWPDGVEGAVSLSFDDGRRTQVEVALVDLNRLGLKGTFYLCPGAPVYSELVEQWDEASAQGHELGNHTMSHPCSIAFQEDPSAKGLDTMSLEDMERDILDAEQRLRLDFPDTGPRSFAYPCYQTHVGRGADRESYVPVVARHFVAGRAVGEHGFFNHPLTCDLFALWCAPGDHMRAEEMIGLAERAAVQGRWLIMAFHDVGDDRLGTLRFDFVEFLEFLDRSRSRLWTAPVREIAGYIRDRR